MHRKSLGGGGAESDILRCDREFISFFGHSVLGDKADDGLVRYVFESLFHCDSGRQLQSVDKAVGNGLYFRCASSSDDSYFFTYFKSSLLGNHLVGQRNDIVLVHDGFF